MVFARILNERLTSVSDWGMGPVAREMAAARFAPMKRLNARLAFYAWWIAGGLMMTRLGFEAFFTVKAALFFLVGSYFAIYVAGYANFLAQRGVALALQGLLAAPDGTPPPWGARFVNGVGIGMAPGAAVWAAMAAHQAGAVLF
ncbi:MAG: hypothetical protein AAGC95_14485 [Pseudomonadota bacterium]